MTATDRRVKIINPDSAFAGKGGVILSERSHGRVRLYLIRPDGWQLPTWFARDELEFEEMPS